MAQLLQDRFKGVHSDVYTAALRAIPGDILLTLPDHQVDALVTGIIAAMNKAVDATHAAYTREVR